MAVVRHLRVLLALATALVGTAATAAALHEVGSRQGSWVGEAQVAIFAPRLHPDDNPLASMDGQAVRLAALVDRVVNNARVQPRVTSRSLTLADQGMRHDSVIALVNLGGQWADDFSRPFIRIEAVDSTRAATRARLRADIERVETTLDRLQDEAGVAASDRATAQLVPAAPRTWFEGTHPTRALLATGLLGAVLTWAASVRVWRRRPGDRAAAGGVAPARVAEPPVLPPVATAPGVLVARGNLRLSAPPAPARARALPAPLEAAGPSTTRTAVRTWLVDVVVALVGSVVRHRSRAGAPAPRGAS